MQPQKLFVFLLDALCTQDIEIIKTLPHMGWVLSEGALIRHVEPVYPSFTYPCHCSIITGNSVKGHGIPHNEKLEVENPYTPWYNQRSDIKCETIFDVAKRAGRKTCALSWPVSGKADIDYNMPMIVPIGYQGYDPYPFLEGNATQELLDRYYWKYSRFLKGADRNLDAYTMALAPDILRDYGQPDLMFVKMCDLDTVRHRHGVNTPFVAEQLHKHDEEFAVLLESIRRYGDFDNTNFVIMGDHGHQDIQRTFNVNLLLKQRGFIRTNEQNRLVDYDAYCFSVSLSAWITLKNPEDDQMREKVYSLLCEIRDDPEYPVGYVFTKQEAEEQFGLVGPLDFVIEGNEPCSFDATLAGDDIFCKYLGPGHYNSVASHGHLPWKDETTTLFACGPGVKKGAVLERTRMINEAPTLAALCGLTMQNIEGETINEILNTSGY